MKTLHASLFPIMAAFALAGCGGEQNAASEKGGGGQVLDGSISDAMLPYDTVRSQPPYLDPIASDSAYDADAAISVGQPNASASQSAGADAAADSDADSVTPAEE